MAPTNPAARSLVFMPIRPVRACALAMFSAALFVTNFFSSPLLNAQEATDQAPKNDLTEGLLDLLIEPSKTGNGQMPAGPTSTPAVDRQLQSELSDKPAPASIPRTTEQAVMGEDIGTLGKHPLAEVQSEMETAALWLRNLRPVDKTQGVQREIVARLDRLIGELEQQQPQTAPASSNTSASDTKQTKQSSQTGDDSRQPGSKSELAEKASTQEPSSRDPADPAHAAENGSESGPSQPGLSSPSSQRRSNVVDLNDPTALQRSAWGSLPDRVRDQMQSRMVERFLPSYREDIEAYYRALAK